MFWVFFLYIGKMSKPSFQVTIIGSSGTLCNDKLYNFGEELGEKLAKIEVHLFSGALNGFMEAVFKGFSSVKDRKTVCTGISPYFNKDKANPYCDIVIPTGMGHTRNAILINSGDIIVAAGGGAGTLSELAIAWQFGKKVLCYDQAPGWAEATAGIVLDSRKTDLLIPVSSTDEICKEIEMERMLRDF